VFTATSESFCQKNINTSVAGSFARFRPVIQSAKQEGLKVRGYVSCVIACPYEGAVAPRQVRKVTQALLDLGCYQVSYIIHLHSL
jgi:hydroxymethylglutaryl-CoA lyase